MKRAVAIATAAAVSLVLAGRASAHAILSPPVAKAKVIQQFTLAVPTEEANATTTQVELTVPNGFAIDSFEPEPGWKRSEQATGSGEEKVVQKVTWSGGKVPTGEDAVFRLNASLDSSKTYVFHVRQTYSNGKIVDWSGPESSDTPAPRIDSVSSLGGGGTTLLTIIALVVAGIAVVLGIAGLAARGRPLA